MSLDVEQAAHVARVVALQDACLALLHAFNREASPEEVVTGLAVRIGADGVGDIAYTIGGHEVTGESLL